MIKKINFILLMMFTGYTLSAESRRNTLLPSRRVTMCECESCSSDTPDWITHKEQMILQNFKQYKYERTWSDLELLEIEKIILKSMWCRIEQCRRDCFNKNNCWAKAQRCV